VAKWGGRSRAAPLKWYGTCIIFIIQQGHGKETEMDFIKDIQARDWMIAAIAFVAGAFIF
jgi:hypothetical protein